MTTCALVCENLTVSREAGASPTLVDISASIGRGEKVALVGLNGSGKTTLLSSIVGLVPHEGRIFVCDEVLTRRNADRIRTKVGFLFNVPEDQLLFPTAIEDAAFGLIQSGLEPPEAFERTRKTLDELGIGHLAKRSVHRLSHGQKQRVALAGAIVTAPPLLLLDEPTAALDPPAKNELAALLSRLDSAQIIATHDLDFAEKLCSRVLLLEGGTIAADGDTIAKIRQRWGV